MVRKKLSISLLSFVALALAGCNPGIIDVPNPQVTNASDYFFAKNSFSTFYDSSSANGWQPINIAIKQQGLSNTFSLFESRNGSDFDTLNCSIDSESVRLSGLSIHSFIPLPKEYSIKPEFILDTLFAAPQIDFIASSGSSLIAASNEFGLFYSQVFPSDWKSYSKDILDAGSVFTAFSKGETLFVGTSTGKIYYLLPGTTNWTPLQSPIKNPISALTYNTFEGKLYVSSKDTVYEFAFNSMRVDNVYPSPEGNIFTSLATINNYKDSITTLVAGSGKGLFYRYRDSGWVSVSKPSGSIISMITTPRGIYCSTTTNVFFSSNGISWSLVQAVGKGGYLAYGNDSVIVMNPAGIGYSFKDTVLVLKAFPITSIANLATKVTDVAISGGHYFAATDKGVLSYTNGDQTWKNSSTGLRGSQHITTKETAGEIVLLHSHSGTSSIDSSWNMCTLVPTGSTSLSFPITARIVGHLDNIIMPDSTKYSDIIEVRYSYELGATTPIPYWDIYYAKNEGPIIIRQISDTTVTRKIYRRKF